MRTASRAARRPSSNSPVSTQQSVIQHSAITRWDGRPFLTSETAGSGLRHLQKFLQIPASPPRSRPARSRSRPASSRRCAGRPRPGRKRVPTPAPAGQARAPWHSRRPTSRPWKGARPPARGGPCFGHRRRDGFCLLEHLEHRRDVAVGENRRIQVEPEVEARLRLLAALRPMGERAERRTVPMLGLLEGGADRGGNAGLAQVVYGLFPVFGTQRVMGQRLQVFGNVVAARRARSPAALWRA